MPNVPAVVTQPTGPQTQTFGSETPFVPRPFEIGLAHQILHHVSRQGPSFLPPREPPLRAVISKRRITAPPGWRLRVFSRFIFSPKTFQRVFEGILSDLQNEYAAALAEDRRLDRMIFRKAPWVRFRGYWAFWESFCLQGPLSFGKRLVQIWKHIP